VQVSSAPPSLNWDEISHGYNAYSILKTGKDEWGRALPTIFRAYGDYKLPVYIYSTVLPVAVFGLNEFAVRFVSVAAGVISVFLTYKLASFLFRDHKRSTLLALVSAFLVAVSPWSLFLSRGAFEANLALTFVIAGAYLFLVGLSRPKFFIVSMAMFGLSVWTYNSARVFAPLLIFGLVIIYKGELLRIYKTKKSIILGSLFIILFFFVPMFHQLANPVGQARYSKVSILDEGAINFINERRNTSDLPQFATRIVYNKGTYFLYQFGSNYLSHFAPGYLFVNGGDQYQFSMPGHGLLFITTAPFLLAGIFLTGEKAIKKDKTSLLLLAWFVLAPIASSITREAPHVLRSAVMLPTPFIFTAIGVVEFANYLNQRHKNDKLLTNPTVITLLCSIVIIIPIFGYIANYMGDYKRNYSWAWQYGYKEMVHYLGENSDDYAKVIITKKYGEPHEFLLFYWPWDPHNYQEDKEKIRFFQTDWYWVDKFDKFYFVNDWEVVGTSDDPRSPNRFILESRAEDVDCSQIRCLLVTSPGNVPEGWVMLETIYFLDGTSAFEIYEN